VRRALALVAAALLAGCAAVSPGTREPDRYFILDAAPGRQAAARVRVAPTSAAGFYDTQDIVYSRAPGTRAYYQFNHWTERPGTARISLTAELSDPASRRLLARRSFRRAAPAASYDAPGAVQGLRQALGELLDDVAAWVEAEAGRGQ
jgi:cholesterol transport system auxiliary component